MKKILIPALTAALLCSSAFALETSVAPKVTDIKNHSPKTGLIVGNSYSFYNCGVHSYLRGLTRENKQDWKARIITISSGRLSYHDVEQYMGPHEMDPYAKKDEKGNLINPMFDVVILQGMSTEPIAEKSIPTFKKFLNQHVATIKECYRKRRDVMIQTMEREFPPEAKFTHPNGGLFTWVELPDYINTNEMAKQCLARNVAYVPGDGFFPDAGHNNCIRLNYSCMPEEKIEQGMTILGEVIKENIKK